MAKKAKTKKKAAKKSVSLISKLLSQYKRLALQLSQQRQTCSDFNDRHLPAWETWKSKNLSKAINELSALKFEYDQIAERLNRVAELSWYGNLKAQRAAYHKVILEEQEQDDDDDEVPNFKDLKDDPFIGSLLDSMLDQWLLSRGIDPDDLSDEQYEAARDKFAESFDHAGTGDHDAFNKSLMDISRDDSSENKSAIKSLYRKLAKHLHPDKNPNGGDFEAGLWNDTQTAYQQGDKRQLIHIDLRYRIGSGLPIEKEDTPDLRHLVEHLNFDCQDLRSDIREFKSHPAWDFLQKSKQERQQLAQKLASDFKSEIKHLTAQLAYIKAEENRLKFPPKPRPKKKKVPPIDKNQQDFPF